MKTVQIGFDNLPRSLRKLVPGIEKAANKAVLATAAYAVATIKNQAKKTVPKPIATGAYYRGWKVRKTRDRAVVENDTAQAYFVEVGRGPGPAPLEPFIKWAAAKLGGIGFEHKSIGKLAVLARNKVVKKGYSGRFVVKNSIPRIRARLVKELNKALKEFDVNKEVRGSRARVRMTGSYGDPID